jgi:hypothetical protein
MDDDHVIILGPPRSVILVKVPNPMPEAHRRLLTTIDIVSPYDDEHFLATCRTERIAELRAAGAEVIVLEADSNRYAERVDAGTEATLVAFIDERKVEARDELMVAERGRDRDREGNGSSTA